MCVFLIARDTNTHTRRALSKKASQPFETMQSLRGRYLGNVSGGEAQSKAARYKEMRKWSRSQTNTLRHEWERGTVGKEHVAAEQGAVNAIKIISNDIH